MTGDNFYQKKQAGFSLMEAIVALAIFVVVVTASFSALVMSIRAQRAVLAEKELSENVNFAVEFISRQMRVAKRDGGGICISADTTYETPFATEVRFINANDKCVRFFLSAGAIQYENITDASGIIPLTTSAVVSIDALEFVLLGESVTDSEQPRVTINIEASGAGTQPEVRRANINIQTSVTARGLDVPTG